MLKSAIRDEAKYPINVVSHLTGLAKQVIRIWELRYGAVRPFRTKTNRRLYSNSEINRLLLLHQVTKSGHPIGQIARLSEEALQMLLKRRRP